MSGEITRLLHAWRDGEEEALNELMPIVHRELKRQARSYLLKERKNHTIQPTELVNEAYLRIASIDEMNWANRAHFYAIAATTMRRVLVDHARKIAAEKRGGDRQRVTLANLRVPGNSNSPELLDLDAALKKLAEMNDRRARVVEMKFFGGLEQKEIAEVLGVNPKTVQRDWQYAKLWLYRELQKPR